MNKTPMTEATERLFRDIFADQYNWSGTPPCFNHITAATRGNLTDLKKRGLVTTFRSDGEEWIEITEAGNALGLNQRRIAELRENQNAVRAELIAFGEAEGRRLALKEGNSHV